MPRVIFHVDMDAFFASVEQRDEPSYRGQPVIVGSPPDRRGVVCAASYEARRYGVRSAMPSRTAGKLCPHGIYVKPRMEAYRAESRLVMEILRASGGRLQQVSVDEAYLDLSARFPAGEADEALRAALPVAREIRERIRAERSLTASIGVAANKFLAKLGSDLEKPDGLTLIPEAGKAAFLRPLSVARIPGVGPVTTKALASVGIATMADLQDTRADLRAVAGSFADRLRALAVGEDARELDFSGERKSISSETTFRQDTEDRSALRAALKGLCLDVAETLERLSLGARTVSVKVRYPDFTTLTRQVRLEEPLMSVQEIYRISCYLLARDRLVNQPLRLLGVSVSGLVLPTAQMQLAWEA